MNLFRRLECVWQVERLTPAQRLVLANLAYRADETTGICYPSAGRIATDTGMSRRGVQKAITALASKGLIVVLSSGSGRGRNAPNRYRLTFLELTNTVRHSTEPDWRTTREGMANNAAVIGEPGSHEPHNLKRTAPNAGALALEARAPRRSQAVDHGESANEKRRRQILDVADLLRLRPAADESEQRFLARVLERKAQWDRDRGLQ